MKKIFLGVYMIATGLFAVMLHPTAVSAQLHVDDAYKAIVKIHTYTLSKDGFLTDWQTGTGVIIDPTGIVLTNEHVASVRYSYDDSESVVGYQVCMTEKIAEEPDCAFTARLIASDKASDLALLKLVQVGEDVSTGNIFPYIEPLGMGTVTLNEEVRALGYPEVGGDTISITKGIVSGRQNRGDKNWIKTDAKISFGSSGGALINNAGRLVGITTEVYSDLASSLGYAVDIGSVLPWINRLKYITPNFSPLEKNIITLIRKQWTENASNLFYFDRYDFGVSKPNGWVFDYIDENRVVAFNPADDGGYVSVSLLRTNFPAQAKYFDLLLKTELAKDGSIAQANFVKNETVTLNGMEKRHIQVTGIQRAIDQYFIPNQDVSMRLSFDFGKDDKDASSVRTMLGSVSKNSRSAPGLLQQFQNASPQFSFSASTDWYIQKFDGKSTPVELVDKDFTAHVEVFVEKRSEQMRTLSNDDILQAYEKNVENANAASRNANLTTVLLSKDAHVRLSDYANNVIQYQSKSSNLGTGGALFYTHTLIVPLPNDSITFTMRYFGSDQKKFEEKVVSLKKLLATLSLSTPQQVATPVVVSPPVVVPPPSVVSGTSIKYDRDAQRAAAVSINTDKLVVTSTETVHCQSGTLIKSKSSPAVYYCGSNGKRFVFPNLQTYTTWYENFNTVITISDADLANIPIGGMVTYRPGTRMIKTESSPIVYAISANGELHPIGSEEVALRLYGSGWNKMIDDISDAFFVNYRIGSAINE